MFKKNDKQRLYWLIDQYLLNCIDARTFCDEYYYCYNLELERNTLNPNETKAFSTLAIIVNRFTEYEEDLKNYPGVYFSEKQLMLKVIETKTLLTEK